MEKCPFWSTSNKIESCDKECPMCKGEDDCVFQLYDSDNLIIKDKREKIRS